MLLKYIFRLSYIFRSRKQFECESTKMKTPVSENTQAKLDFDFLETTPLLSEKNPAQGASNTSTTNNDDQNFDSLGNTPATEKLVTSKIKHNSSFNIM